MTTCIYFDAKNCWKSAADFSVSASHVCQSCILALQVGAYGNLKVNVLGASGILMSGSSPQ